MGRPVLIVLVTAVLVGLSFVVCPHLPGGAAESRTIPILVRAGAMTPAESAVTGGG